MPRRRDASSFCLTARDSDVLAYVAMLRGVPLEHLAERFFDADPFTGKKNKNPRRACERRLRELASAGFVRFVRESDGEQRRQMVIADNALNGVSFNPGPVVHRASARRPPTRHGAHHIKTLDALAELRRAVEARGGQIVRVELDADLRARLRAGRRTQRGDRYEAMPDAVAFVAMPGRAVEKIAVEYVTSKYTDADIRAKHRAFESYAKTIWVADKPHTAERVRALTGARCSVIS